MEDKNVCPKKRENTQKRKTEWKPQNEGGTADKNAVCCLTVKKGTDIPIAPPLYSLNNKRGNSILALRKMNYK